MSMTKHWKLTSPTDMRYRSKGRSLSIRPWLVSWLMSGRKALSSPRLWCTAGSLQQSLTYKSSLSLSLCCTCIFHYRRITLSNRESCVHQHVSQCTKQIHISNYPIITLKLIWYFLHQSASGLKLYIYMCTSILII